MNLFNSLSADRLLSPRPPFSVSDFKISAFPVSCPSGRHGNSGSFRPNSGLTRFRRPAKVGLVTATKVIEEMDGLPPDEQAKVIQHAFELARLRQLSPDELGELAERLTASSDPAEIIRLKSAMKRGFYGE